MTKHVPTFDFLTGCGEFKRCEGCKRTLKDPFASHLAEFDTTLKLLRMTDQIFPLRAHYRDTVTLTA